MIESNYKSFEKYVKKKRWMSYWYQVKETLASNPKSVLLIGIGNGIIPAILVEKEIKVYTFDYDLSMKPDFCGDIRDIGSIVSDLKVDTILCCQVLEHVEFQYFPKIINDFEKIAKERVIISLPHCHIAFSVWIKIPIFKSIEWKIIIPCFWIKRCFFNHEHFWEVGMRNYSKKKIELIFSEKFEILNKYHVTMNPYHLFYVLGKKEEK